MKSKSYQSKSQYIYRVFRTGSFGTEIGSEYFFNHNDAIACLNDRVDLINSTIERKNNLHRKQQKRWASFYFFGREITDIINQDEDQPYYEKVVVFEYLNQYGVKIVECSLRIQKLWVK